MSTRRSFLKILFGFGAFILPWTALPEKLFFQINNLLGKPKVLLQLPDVIDPAISASPEVLKRKAIEDIRALSDSEMEGRRAGTTGETRAAIYLAEQLSLLGLQPLQDQYFQLFSVPPMEERLINGRALFRPGDPTGLRMPSCNILAEFKGKKENEYIIISAHYDHLGIYQGKLCPGANDNASGAGCVLEVLRRLCSAKKEGKTFERNIIAAFWSAEEMGYIGSEYFVAHPPVPLHQIKAVINLDTVGNGEKDQFILWSTGNNVLEKTVEEAFEKNKAEVSVTTGNGHHSDEVSFKNTIVPAVTILSKDWLANNHTPQDDISMIQEEKLDLVCDIVFDLVDELC